MTDEREKKIAELETKFNGFIYQCADCDATLDSDEVKWLLTELKKSRAR